MHEHVEAVDLDEIDRRNVQVAITPLPSLLVSLLDALDDPVHRSAPIATIDHELERIAATPPEQIEAEVEELRACPGKDRWRLASRGGSRWRDNQWQLSSNISRRLHLSEHPLRLVPIIHPTRRVLLTDDDRGGLRELGYSLRDVEGPLSGLAPAPEALESLLGAPRATCLRRLDRPVTAGALAEALAAVPSAATHHINALERAGLVRRERSGRRVLVWRTRRGTALLELYS